MKPGKVGELVEVAHFQFEAAEPAFHEAVLPGLASAAGRQPYLQLVAELLVAVAQIF